MTTYIAMKCQFSKQLLYKIVFKNLKIPIFIIPSKKYFYNQYKRQICQQFKPIMISSNRSNLPHNQPQKQHFAQNQKGNGHTFFQHQKENILTINPTFHPNTTRPLISPKKQQQLSDRLIPKASQSRHSKNLKQEKFPQTFGNKREQMSCCNHPNKMAEFKVDSDQGLQYFCGRCAAQLATQGYEVERLVNNGMSMKTSKRNQIPSLPQYEGQPIYEQIISMLKECNAVIQGHNFNIQKFSHLQEGYNQQIDLTTAFYDRLVQIIDEMKQDHLNDLAQQRDKYAQIADIENDSLRENIIEVNVIKNDVENHIEEVLEGIKLSGNTVECRQSLDHYRQKLAFFRHRTEEQLDQLSQVTRYSQRKIDKMLDQFQNFLKTLWDDEEGAAQEIQQRHYIPNQMNSVMTVKNIHQILPKGISYEGKQEKRAFRNLQAEEQIEELSMQQRKSPNFKKI